MKWRIHFKVNDEDDDFIINGKPEEVREEVMKELLNRHADQDSWWSEEIK